MPSEQADIDGLIANFLERHKLSESFAETAREWYIPLADNLLLHQKSAGNTLFVGVNGSQGSGKSTMCDFLLEYLSLTYNKHVISLSLDDFYYSTEKRAQLASQIHPLLATRGVPGTHDVQGMQNTFEALAKQQVPLTVPRFDKATDNPCEPSEWLVVDKPIEIVLMEGWCWGIVAQSNTQLTEPVNSLEASHDLDASWRTYVNEALKRDYEPLYDAMHYWVMLKAPAFSTVFNWRCEQEQKLRDKLARENVATEQLAGLMTDGEIARFIAHYQRLTEHGLASLPDTCDTVFELDVKRQIIKARLGS